MRKRSSVSGSRAKSAEVSENIDAYFDQGDDIEVTEGEPDLKNCIATFSFAPEAPDAVKAETESQKFVFQQPSADNAAAAKAPNTALKGVTPPIDGEYFTLKRCYQFRPSTIRKLNEIKAKHSDVNAYLNTILDEAILHYYDHILNNSSRT